MSTILIVDDESSIRQNLKKFFSEKGHLVEVAEDGKKAIDYFQKKFADLVLLDLRLTDISGLEVLKKIKSLSPATAVIIITAFGDVETAVKAMQLKAENFVLKPIDLMVLSSIVEKGLENSRAKDEINYLKNKLFKMEDVLPKIDIRFPMEVEHAIGLLAKNSTTNVLILGETGTGKGMVAKTIHELSDRCNFPFVDISCAGLSSELLESELFGHEPGAFTDAKTFKKGLLEIADEGTVFLDEVGELSMGVQAKLLKVIEQKTFRRLGGVVNIKVDVRIIAATNVDLQKAVSEKKFREDLYFRLSVIPIYLPALRHRTDEIMPLAEVFLKEFRKRIGKEIHCFAPEIAPIFTRYGWPGNIRELRNIVERAVIICEENTITAAHLPDNLSPQTRMPGVSTSNHLSMEALEKEHLEKVLREVKYNRTKAAEILGMHRTTLIKKVKKYRIRTDQT